MTTETAPLIFEVRGLGVKKGSGSRPTYRGGSVGGVRGMRKGWVAVRSYAPCRPTITTTS